jgi:hypothetical protein
MVNFEKMCPSTPAAVNVVLLGVIGSDGRLGYLSPEVRVDQEFISAVEGSNRAPEKRFRFAGRCVEDSCGHWTGSRCSVIDTAAENEVLIERMQSADELPKCVIRARCRWFSQKGGIACRLCPFVVHNPEP